MSEKRSKDSARASFQRFNEKLFFSLESSGISTTSRARLVRGPLSRAVDAISRALSYTTSRAYGSFCATFGILTVVLHLIRYYFDSSDIDVIPSLIIGGIFLLISLPLLLSDAPIALAVQDNALTDYIFFEFFLLKRKHRVKENAKTVPTLLAIFLGCIPAVIGFVFDPVIVALTLLSFVVIVFSLVSPEFTMILTAVLLPYLPLVPYYEIVLATLGAVAFLSFALKAIVGKRVFNFEIYDLLIIPFIVLILVSGIVSKDTYAVGHSLIFAGLTLGYFTASNLFVNRRLADLAINSVIVSSVPVSIYSIIVCFADPVKRPEGISGFFKDTTSLCAYLLVTAILTLGFITQKSKTYKKIIYGIIFVLQVLTLVIAQHPAIIFAAIGATVAYIIVNLRKTPTDVLLIVIAACYTLVFIFPKPLSDFFSSLGFVNGLSFDSLSDSLSFIEDNVLLGGGFSLGSLYGGAGLVTAILSSVGIFAFIIFFLLVALRLRHVSYYRTYVRGSLLNTDSNVALCAFFALIMFGAHANFFTDPITYYLLFIIFGIESAALRAAKKGHYDTLGYYSDQRSSESSAIDLRLH